MLILWHFYVTGYTQDILMYFDPVNPNYLGVLSKSGAIY